MYHVCERARQDVKVVFVGQGPDELFGGYPRHIGIRYGSYWRNLPAWTQSTFTSIVNSLPRNETLKRGVYSLNDPGGEWKGINRFFQLYRGILSMVIQNGI